MKKAFADIAQQLANVPPHATGALIVDLGSLRRNYRMLRAAAPSSETSAVLKADAYGIGAAKAAPALEMEDCKTFFVATLAEARALRSLIANATIYVLDGLLPGTAASFEDLNARPVLGSFAEIAEWTAFCDGHNKVRHPAAIHIDTGMTRLGLSARDARQLASDAATLARIEPSLIMSHLACADDAGYPKNEAQLALFEEVSALFPGVPRSLANSAGIALGPRFHFELTRPGISLYGGRAQSWGPNAMEPVVSLYGRIAQVAWAERGETVGYGASQTLRRRTRIATVCVGYADGFSRAVSANDHRDGPPGMIGEHRLPLLGRLSMDLTTFDATDVPEDLVRRGGWVELIGDHVSVDDVAAFAGTIGYEVLTSLGSRYSRVYVDE
jgi:alanine racemase